MEERKKEARRREEVLGEVILCAAWKELVEKDYVYLTVESVATRAGANKAILYRRWDNKLELVIAALRKYSPRITDKIPNAGSLRDDVYAFLHARIGPVRAINVQAIQGLIVDPWV